MRTYKSVLNQYSRELRALLYLAGPILGAQLATTGMTFVDTSMAGQYSPLDLAAIALGASVWVPLSLLIRGTLMATTPTVAQLFGGRKLNEIAAPVRQGFWIAIAMSIVAVLILRNAGVLYDWLQVEPEVSVRSVEYLRAISWGVPAVCLYQLMCCYNEGMSKTKPAMVFSFIALFVNIPVNYVLIYGKFGFPELGGVGCGFATAICFWLMFGLMVLYTKTDGQHQKIGLLDKIDLPDLSKMADLLKLGLPIGLSIFFEAGIFSVIALVIGKLGAVTVAGHQIALNFTSLCFVIPLSMSMGVTIRVGQTIGAGTPEKARFTSFSGVITTLMTAAVSASIMLFFPEAVAAIYTQDPQVSRLAAELLFFAALFQFADGVQIASIGALRGYKDTRVPMIVVLFACWVVAFPFGYTLALTDYIVEPMGPHGLWIGLVTALTISATALMTRLNIISKRYQSAGDSVQGKMVTA